MYKQVEIDATSKEVFYNLLQKQVRSLLVGETDPVANMANIAALLYQALDSINWAGFYRNMGNELLLGPFVGVPACVHIALGRGVCGSCAEQMKSIIVDNVHEFPGHIPCDGASNSEIVIPLVKNDILYGVLDIDSPILNRFDNGDKAGLEEVVRIFLDCTAF